MYLGLAGRRTIGLVDPLSRKTIAAAVALVLCIFTFALFGGEAWAAEQPSHEQPSQPSQATQPGTVESTMTNNGKEVAEPVPGATTPVESSPIEKPSAQTPPPLDSNPSTSEPKPAPHAAPQRFPVIITDGEVVESDPVLTWSETDPESAPDVLTNPAPDAAATLVGKARALVPPGPSSDAGSSVPAVEEVPLPANQASEPLLGAGIYPPAALLKPSSAAPTRPTWVGGAPRLLPLSLSPAAANAVVGAVDSVRSTAAGVTASAAAGVLRTLSGSSSTEPSSSDNGSQQSSEENAPQQPVPPLAPPVGGSAFSLSGGFGHVSLGGGFSPLLVGLLAFSAILLRRDFRTYLISCEMPKPSSALLLPLERPG